MMKPIRVIVLCTIAMLAIGAVLSAQGRGPGSEPRPTPPALAMQDRPTESPVGAPHTDSSKLGWIGVMLENGNGHGARVKAVFPGGPAAFAGLRVGDVLIRIGGAEVHSPQEGETTITRLAPEQPATFTVERGKKTTEMKIIPQSLEEFQQDYAREMLRRDPRDPRFGAHHGISEADMSSELVRRLFEQNERLERSLNEVVKEVHALRKQVAALQK